jgi:uncharacterized BrkB/YihY/UPF0761 family membrane protein
MPLEAAFNRVWGFSRHRPYWKNQAVGFLLATACTLLAVIVLLLLASLRWAADRWLPATLLSDLLRPVSLHLAAPGFAIVALFLFYRFLPNGPVRSADVMPAAIVAGVAAELMRWGYHLLLPYLQVQKNQGPFYISISFALLAYFESFVVLAGAYLATGAGPRELTAGPGATAGTVAASEAT